MILVFLAFISLFNYLLINVIGNFNGLGSWKFISLNEIIRVHTIYEEFNLQMILGYLFAPLAWIIGITGSDIILAGQLLGEKTVINEFIAYLSLKEIIGDNVHNVIVQKRTVIILTYALCGFSNFSSIGIQIGGIGSIAPNQRTVLAKLGLRSLLGGTLACLMTATIAGIFN